MKHHLYQIYYGGFKQKLANWYYCETCNGMIQTKNVTRHKKTFLTNDQ